MEGHFFNAASKRQALGGFGGMQRPGWALEVKCGGRKEEISRKECWEGVSWMEQ